MMAEAKQKKLKDLQSSTAEITDKKELDKLQNDFNTFFMAWKKRKMAVNL
jgi:hypothetical protein